MHIDANQLKEEVLRCDVCIIGGGAAGISIAREFIGTALSVCLLEGGGLELTKQSQDIYQGDAEGTVLTEEDAYLTASRLRYLGGTTNHWRGWCLPLEEIDFQERAWVPESGWPIGKSDLLPYYARAVSVAEVQPFDYRLEQLEGRLGPRMLPDSAVVESRLFHRSAPTRFGQRYRAELLAAEHVTLYSNATAVELETTAGANALTRVRVKNLRGETFYVEAARYVLSAGGVENARLLLASNKRVDQGLGNEHGLVGRYFADHPQIPIIGHVLFSDPRQAILFYGKQSDQAFGHDVYGVFCFSEKAQQEHQLLNHSFFLSAPLRGGGITDFTKRLAASSSELDYPELSNRPAAPLVCPIRAALEQSPNRESRVLLDTDRDELGSLRAKLQWRIPERDTENAIKAFRLFAKELGRFRAGRGKVSISPVEPWPEGSGGGSHHLGTTKMHQSPAKGVVDADCRLHGVDNLYIAGSSVFPTIGFANPTLTIIALSLRLADRLKGELIR